MEDAEIIPSGNPYPGKTVRETVSGEPDSTGFGKQVFLDHYITGRAVKVPYSTDLERPTVTAEGAARLIGRLPPEIVPESDIGVYNLEKQGYGERQPVVFQEISDREMDGSKSEEQFVEGLRFLDDLADRGYALPDLVWDNLHYYRGELKPIDLCEIGAIVSVPESYPRGELDGFQEHVEEMYKSFAFSGQEVAGITLEETASLLEENSRYVEDANHDTEADRPYEELRISLLEDVL